MYSQECVAASLQTGGDATHVYVYKEKSTDRGLVPKNSEGELDYSLGAKINKVCAEVFAPKGDELATVDTAAGNAELYRDLFSCCKNDCGCSGSQGCQCWAEWGCKNGVFKEDSDSVRSDLGGAGAGASASGEGANPSAAAAGQRVTTGDDKDADSSARARARARARGAGAGASASGEGAKDADSSSSAESSSSGSTESSSSGSTSSSGSSSASATSTSESSSDSTSSEESVQQPPKKKRRSAETGARPNASAQKAARAAKLDQFLDKTDRFLDLVMSVLGKKMKSKKK